MAYIEMHSGGPREPIIHDGNAHLYKAPPVVNGEAKAFGLVPRNYTAHPRGSYKWAPVTDIPVFPQADWSRLIAEQLAKQRRLSDIAAKCGPGGKQLPPLDQNGRGYCWMHSPVSAMQLIRGKYGQPWVDLSAYGPACIIKQYRDEGGWGAQGVDWLVQHGCPTSATWPQKSTARSNDTPAMREEMAKYKVTAQFADLESAQYDRNLAWGQFVTLWLLEMPTVCDFNWWGHSVAGSDAVDGTTMKLHTRDESGKLLDIVQFDKVWAMSDPVLAGIGSRILNSWGGWGQNGFGVLTGRQAVPDGGVGLWTVSIAA